MFNIADFIMKTLNGMIGRYPDFQVREYALNWYSKGKLTEEHLIEVETALEAQYNVADQPIEEDAGEVV